MSEARHRDYEHRSRENGLEVRPDARARAGYRFSMGDLLYRHLTTICPFSLKAFLAVVSFLLAQQPSQSAVAG